MIYQTAFYSICPVLQQELLIEVTFSIDEQAADRLEVWGFMVDLPPTLHLEILKVQKDGMDWEDYPEEITTQIHEHDWHSILSNDHLN